MFRYITLLCLCICIAIACGQKPQPPADTPVVGADSSGNKLKDYPIGPITKITDVNSTTIGFDDASVLYNNYKLKIFKNKADTNYIFCGYKNGFLKCGHFPKNHLQEHLCIDETSLIKFVGIDSNYYDGIRLYPCRNGIKISYLFVFTKKSLTVSGGRSYDDISASPIVLVDLKSIKKRLCEIGTGPLPVPVKGQVRAMNMHRLCTPRCPDGEDGNFLFDY